MSWLRVVIWLAWVAGALMAWTLLRALRLPAGVGGRDALRWRLAFGSLCGSAAGSWGASGAAGAAVGSGTGLPLFHLLLLHLEQRKGILSLSGSQRFPH